MGAIRMELSVSQMDSSRNGNPLATSTGTRWLGDNPHRPCAGGAAEGVRGRRKHQAWRGSLLRYTPQECIIVLRNSSDINLLAGKHEVEELPVLRRTH